MSTCTGRIDYVMTGKTRLGNPFTVREGVYSAAEIVDSELHTQHRKGGRVQDVALYFSRHRRMTMNNEALAGRELCATRSRAVVLRAVR